MSSCAVLLDYNKTEYRPGETITGKIVCVFNDLKSLSAIKIRLKGKEENQWPGTETYYDEHAKRKKSRPIYYTGHNIFLLTENVLKGEGDLGPGRFEFPFSLQLPDNVPSSYYGRYGGVYFSVGAAVERPSKSDYTDSKQITVLSPINLNDIRDQLQLQPVAYSDEKMTCCWCCTSGPITMDVYLEKEAFVPGEVVKIKADINNMSNGNVERIVIKIGTTVKSMVTHPSIESQSKFELLAANSFPGVHARDKRAYNIELEIPQSAMVPNFNLCTLFSQKSKLQVTAVLSIWHEDMDITTDITIGHIPIGGSYERYQSGNFQQDVNSMASTRFAQNSQATTYPPYPPPSYTSDVVLPPSASAQHATPNSSTEFGPRSTTSSTPAALPPQDEISTSSTKKKKDEPPSYEEAMNINQTNEG